MYMTYDKSIKNKSTDKNNIYLVMVDPYYNEIQVARFKSQMKFNNHFRTCMDFMITAIIQSTLNGSIIQKCSSQILAQYVDEIKTSSLEILKTESDSENSSESESDEQEMKEDLDNDEVDSQDECILQQIKMFLDKESNVYYVENKNK